MIRFVYGNILRLYSGRSKTVIVVLLAVITCSNRLAASSDPEYAYVINQGSVSMSVIDTTTRGVIDTVPLTGAVFIPGDVALAPDGTRLYVTDHIGAVAVLDAQTYAVLATVSLGTNSDVEDIEISPDGSFAYAATRNTQNVSVVDTATLTLVTNVPVGDLPSRVAFTPDGSLAYVVNFLSDTITVIDTATHTVANTIPVCTFPNDVAMAEVGGSVKAYVACWFDSAVSVIDVASGEVTEVIAVNNAWTLEASRDGSFVAVAQWGFSVKGLSIIDTTTNTISSTLAVPVEQANIKLTPDDAFAYLTDFSGAQGAGDSVFVVDIANNSIATEIPVGEEPFGMAIGTPRLTQPPHDPATRADCMNDGWATFGFANQGRCIQFVNTGKDSR